MPTDPNPNVSEILNRQRIAAAYTTLTDPEEENSHIDLEDAERKVIADALQRSPHPLGGFARTLLDHMVRFLEAAWNAPAAGDPT